MGQTAVAGSKGKLPSAYYEKETIDIAADPVVRYMTKEKLQKLLAKTRKSMEAAVKELDFLEAARLRDEIFALEKLLESK
jgi:excinuclease ABC subunit B